MKLPSNDIKNKRTECSSASSIKGEKAITDLYILNYISDKNLPLAFTSVACMAVESTGNSTVNT